ncbi:hypothetical protein [Isoptericola sediminis]|uniref:Uncharacterized protein n=1 Tax=Isoptericola sediminis TaxID=2733572 RepID=A0A849JWG1_9MICO|nr:hypothetical protein [Isoptericola sediminis]NNU26934.1 hypothetical protein [Isoptericola sediminis]
MEVTSTVRTDAGLFALWRTSRFSEVAGIDEWEDRVAGDSALAAVIAEGALVPINIGGDGAYEFTVRVVSELGTLTEREEAFRVVSSQPYLLVSDGMVALGGLEAVGEDFGAPMPEIPLDSGRYAVQIHLIDWKAEPGATDADGMPTTNALADFVIEMCRVQDDGDLNYCQSAVTFARD